MNKLEATSRAATHKILAAIDAAAQEILDEQRTTSRVVCHQATATFFRSRRGESDLLEFTIFEVNNTLPPDHAFMVRQPTTRQRIKRKILRQRRLQPADIEMLIIPHLNPNTLYNE